MQTQCLTSERPEFFDKINSNMNAEIKGFETNANKTVKSGMSYNLCVHFFVHFSGFCDFKSKCKQSYYNINIHN